MSDAAVYFSLTGDEILSVHLRGKWQMETDVPSVQTVMKKLSLHPSVKRIVFDATALGSWDSNLLIFFLQISKAASKREIAVQKDGLPAGVRQLIDLATEVTPHPGSKPQGDLFVC